MRALIGFGSNMLLAHADGGHGRKALAELEFFAHADLFMTPTAELADVVLPIASSFEREALKFGFEVSLEAQSHVQSRQAVVPPPGEARPDTDIIFDLAARLGLAEQFWNGDIEAAYRHQLAPTGITLEQLRGAPGGVRVRLQTRHAKQPRRTQAARRCIFSPALTGEQCQTDAGDRRTPGPVRDRGQQKAGDCRHRKAEQHLADVTGERIEAARQGPALGEHQNPNQQRRRRPSPAPRKNGRNP